MSDYVGCSDHGCVFGHPGGPGTNGGCKCLLDLPIKRRRAVTEALRFHNEKKALLAALDRGLRSAHSRFCDKWNCIDCRGRLCTHPETVCNCDGPDVPINPLPTPVPTDVVEALEAAHRDLYAYFAASPALPKIRAALAKLRQTEGGEP